MALLGFGLLCLAIFRILTRAVIFKSQFISTTPTSKLSLFIFKHTLIFLTYYLADNKTYKSYSFQPKYVPHKKRLETRKNYSNKQRKRCRSYKYMRINITNFQKNSWGCDRSITKFGISKTFNFTK